MLDNAEIQEYLSHYKTERKTSGMDKKFIEFTHSEEEDEYSEKKIFTMTSFYNIFHIMKMIFDEMLLLIRHQERREVFMDVCLNGNIKNS
ncbi:MAG: hypothetical protein LUG96_14065 [Tannerellaceae bacterium]|nr:hypothetical protein [Tannerellaceae bacterium]MCD7916265.1 hypothetical protein [Tannerellaceae bacterium]